jgi:hypothetical protein
VGLYPVNVFENDFISVFFLRTLKSQPTMNSPGMILDGGLHCKKFILESCMIEEIFIIEFLRPCRKTIEATLYYPHISWYMTNAIIYPISISN